MKKNLFFTVLLICSFDYILTLSMTMVSVSQADTYYVSANGNVLAAKKADAKGPCAVNSDACLDMPQFNAAAFSGDDVINLCDDDGDFTVAMVVPSSGTLGHPITIKAGPGEEPVLNGAEICDDAGDDWIQVGDTNVWWYNLGNITPHIVEIDGKIWTMVQDNEICGGLNIPWGCCTGAGEGTCEGYAGLSAGKWYYCNSCNDATDNYLYIYSTTDPDTLYPNKIKATQRNNLIVLNANDYITFDGIEFELGGTSRASQWYYGGAIGDYAGNPGHYSTNITINNCTFTNNAVSVSCMNDADGNGSDNWTITNNVFNGCADAMGIVIYGPSGATISENTLDYFREPIMIAGASSNITINNNTMNRYGIGTMGVQRFGIGLSAVGGDHFTITNNTVRNPLVYADAYELGFYGSPKDVTITGNKYYQDGSIYGDSGLVVDMYNDGKATISNNYIDNARCIGMFILGGNGHTIKNNYLKDCGDGCYNGAGGQYGLRIVSTTWDEAERTASNHLVSYNVFDHCYCTIWLYKDISARSSGHKIYNNTLYDVGQYGFRVTGRFYGIEFKNNIVYDSSPFAYYRYVYLDSNFSGSIDLDNNLYYGNGKYTLGTINYDTLDLWRGALDNGSSFNGVGNDGNSLFSEPLFISAMDYHLRSNSPAIDRGVVVGLTEDYDRIPIPQGMTVDIGAFEFVPETTVDTIPPTGIVAINNGDDLTYSQTVVISLFATDDGTCLDSSAMMTFSNDGKEWSLAEPYATGKIWTLAPGAGEKTVYAKFCDAAGNWMTEPAEDKIIYEESQSTNTPPIGTVTINGNDYFTNSLTVFLTLLAIDDGKELDKNASMIFSNDGEEWSDPEPYATGKLWTLSPGNGEKTVYVKFCAAGNWMTEPSMDRIYYEASDITCDDPQNFRPVSATASSEWLPRYSKNNTFDGNPLTAWSAFSFVRKEQFITLDLGEMKKLSGLNMYASKMFGTDFFPTDFQIEISRDNNTWASIGKEWGYTPPFQQPYADKWEFDGIDCRYLRITITKSKTLFLFLHLAQIAEIEVYGCDIEEAALLNAAEAPPLSASRESSRSIRLDDVPNANSEELTAPGRPEVRFE